MSVNDILLGLLAIIFPPIAVWVKRGICSADSLINLLLCLLGGFPGLLHAWYIITKYPEDDETPPSDPESAPVTYVRIQEPSGPRGAMRPPNPNIYYGATATHQYSHNFSTTKNVTFQAVNPQIGRQNGNGAFPIPPTYAEATSGGHKFQN